jgi:hypothetical protein
MGKMKEVYIQVMEANEGIPEGLTIGEMSQMKEMEIFNWELYEREKERRRIVQLELENPRETEKTDLAKGKFKGYVKELEEHEKSEQ